MAAVVLIGVIPIKEPLICTVSCLNFPNVKCQYVTSKVWSFEVRAPIITAILKDVANSKTVDFIEMEHF